jgi:fumarate reductase flavoprotein subunit
VVIATGSFAGNQEIIDKYIRPHGFRLGRGLPNTGDGIKMAAELGAITDESYAMDCNGPHHFPYADQGDALQTLIHRPEVIFVNKQGKRFCDESMNMAHHNNVSNSLSRQQDEVCYALIDAGIIETVIQKNTLYSGHTINQGSEWMLKLVGDFEADDKKGVAKVSNSLDEIAAFIGAKPEVLKETIKQFNDACDKGYDRDFLKDKKHLYPFRKPPYYALLGRQGFYSTFGGIKINGNMEVIDKNFNPIGGLYATGDNAGGCIGTVYVQRHAGQSISFAITSGYIAGKSAAKYLAAKK